jgi:hypothetical protein
MHLHTFFNGFFTSSGDGKIDRLPKNGRPWQPFFFGKKMVSQQNTWYGGVTFSFILILHHFLTFFHFSHMPLTSLFTDFFLLKGFFQEGFW